MLHRRGSFLFTSLIMNFQHLPCLGVESRCRLVLLLLLQPRVWRSTACNCRSVSTDQRRVPRGRSTMTPCTVCARCPRPDQPDNASGEVPVSHTQHCRLHFLFSVVILHIHIYSPIRLVAT